MRKKIYKHRILKEKNMKNKSSYKREIYVKDTLRLEVKGFVETKEQKGQREGKQHGGFWCGDVFFFLINNIIVFIKSPTTPRVYMDNSTSNT